MLKKILFTIVALAIFATHIVFSLTDVAAAVKGMNEEVMDTFSKIMSFSRRNSPNNGYWYESRIYDS